MRNQSFGESILEGLTELKEALEKNEPLDDRFTRKRVVLKLDTAVFEPAMIRETRAILQATQVMFAQFLGVSAKTVQAWERGQNSPNDMACRFMDEIRRDPTYWRKRFKAAVVSEVKPKKLARSK